MNAVLKIDARAVERPAYNNDHVAKGGQWMTDNWDALRSYWKALGGTDDNGFMMFASCQWDRERMGF